MQGFKVTSKDMIDPNIVEKLNKILNMTTWQLSEKMNYDGGTMFMLTTVYPDQVKDGKDVVAEFTLTKFPGCCGILISTGTYVCYSFRNKGVGKLLNKLKQDISRGWGYSVLLCTDIDDNPAQRKVLKDNGWEDIYQFVNNRTGNNVNISVIQVR